MGLVEIDWSWHYYNANNVWVSTNLVVIMPFVIACICRFRNIDVNKKLWTDHLSRVSLFLTCLFYLYDMPVKYVQDGADSICQKSFFIHHIASLFIIPPIILNEYVPWWANPIGFLHGFCIWFPDFEPLNYIYACALMFFHYMLFQKPYKDLKYYWITRISLNGVWIFALMLLIGDCSNFLPLTPD
jgi:hypothetical protein